MISPFTIVAKQAVMLIRRLNNKMFICKGCGIEFKSLYPNSTNKFCTPECRKTHKIYEYNCSNCNSIINRDIVSKSQHNFCCEKCKIKFTNSIVKKSRKNKPKIKQSV